MSKTIQGKDREEMVWLLAFSFWLLAFGVGGWLAPALPITPSFRLAPRLDNYPGAPPLPFSPSPDGDRGYRNPLSPNSEAPMYYPGIHVYYSAGSLNSSANDLNSSATLMYKSAINMFCSAMDSNNSATDLNSSAAFMYK
ncbi:MAG: hypothetical protein PHQ65_04505 [Bacteroidales bacterium]|nr:hypothetical protein [Bacteroidales bacterium]MDD3664504.1 hypothetical protein [Bacteroidales bacterium]